MLDAKARKWLHPGLGGSRVRPPRPGPDRAGLLAGYRASFAAANWRLGLGRAGALRPLQERVLAWLGEGVEPGGWEVEPEGALAVMAQHQPPPLVQLWVAGPGLGFALEALWWATWHHPEYQHATPTPYQWLIALEKNLWCSPGQGWDMLRRLAAVATPEARAQAVAVGERLRRQGGPALDALVAYVLPEPAWVAASLGQQCQRWLWACVGSEAQAEQVRRDEDSEPGRLLLSAYAADLVDRLGPAAAGPLGRLKAGLEQDLALYRRGNHPLALAVARCDHLLALLGAPR